MDAVVVWFSTFQKTGERIQPCAAQMERERERQRERERGNRIEIYICLFIHAEFPGLRARANVYSRA